MHSEGQQVKKEKHRVQRGVEMTCLQAEVTRVNAHKVCINLISHEILSDEWNEPPDRIKREEYAEYFEFRGHRYPRTAPLPVRTPNPMYPRSASANGLTGDTTVSMTVLADGSVTDIQLAGTAAHSMDDASLQTLKGWKFKPAMCGTEPVVSDIDVVVSFRLH